MSQEPFTRKEGETIGGYRLLAPLGRGGFSEVWRAAREDGSGAEVALKILVHPEHTAQLRAEAGALALVRGEGIVSILEMNLEHEPPFLVLELAPGKDLRSRVALLRRLGPVAAVTTIEEVLGILARVHEEGIVHGDLKPENVLLDRMGRAKLADFGLSRRITQRSGSLSVSLSLEDARLAGTLDYMAPEQRDGEKPTPRSDVYAMGVVFYELLTGERPQGVFKFPSERDARCPPVIDRTLACALAKDPCHRFADAGAMLGFLRSGLQSDWKELATAHKRIERLLGRWRSHQVVLLLAGVVALVLLAWLAAVAESRPRALVTQDPWAEVFVIAHLALVFAIPAALGRWVRPVLAGREDRLKKLRWKIGCQIASGNGWLGRSTDRSEDEPDELGGEWRTAEGDAST